ncbi:MAG: four helix bundle protein [Chloroflexi bacterium]|nr:four helix bundle protein [Chloroflexota bacterium]
MAQRKDVPFDIRERTFLFGVRVVKFVRTLPRDVAGVELARQLIRSGTSIGANVEEADGAESTKDKIHKLAIGRKEGKESRLWLRTIREAEISKSPETDELIAECHEIVKILSAMIDNLGKSE